jgi:hypothetical protein
MEEDQKWKDDFYKYACAYDYVNMEKELDVKSIKKLIKGRNIECLYKFRSGNLNDIINLTNNQLPSCTISTFNDPFEFLYLPDVDTDMFKKYSEDLLNEIYNFIDETNQNFTVCSFSQYKNNILMWSHYADYHKGFCIEYNFYDVFPRFGSVFPVTYDNDVIERSNNDIRFMLRKSEDWSYEYEWRIINVNENNRTLYSLINMPKPKSIYLGCKIENGLKGYLTKYCKDNNIKLYQSKIKRDKYGLDFDEINL